MKTTTWQWLWFFVCAGPYFGLGLVVNFGIEGTSRGVGVTVGPLAFGVCERRRS